MSAHRRMPTGLYSVGRPADVGGAMDRLRAHWLVLAVPEAEREELVQGFDVYAMPAQWSVFRKGEPAGGLFVVLSGRLRAHLDHGGHVDMGAGEVIGEVSLFLDAPRAADVTTVRDTLLAYLPHDVLTGFASRFPDLWRELGALASRRLTHSADPSPPGVLAVVALDDAPSGAWFAAQVAEALAPYGPTTVLSEVDPDAVRDRSVVGWVSDVEAETATLVLVAGPPGTSWHDLCLRQADRVLVVAHAHGEPVARLTQVQRLVKNRLSTEADVHLVLIQEAGCRIASGTGAWLDAGTFASHHHVRSGHEADAARAARLVTGRGAGLSFAGASSRGMAHTGVLQAIHGQALPVDAVAGSSSGAGAAIGFAMGQTPEEVFASYLEVAEALRPTWRRLVPPFVAAMSGYDARQALRKVYGEVKLEDLLIPVSVVSVDLKRAEVCYLSRGPAWLAARASASLPGFWPPVAHDGRLLVDGGLADNVPFDSLRAGCEHGVMVGVAMLPSATERTAFAEVPDYGDAVSGWRLLAERWLPFLTRSVVPSLFELLIQLIVLPDALRQLQSAQRSAPREHILRPPVPKTGFFELTEADARELIDATRAYCEAELPAFFDRGSRP